ncbi:MAG: dihydrolipoyllysine-residue acetyltransferase [Rhodospirillales bacterium]|nr:dihydrolipoyllysine-residue acetyltransferase [Rhodospirillales bacterium]
MGAVQEVKVPDIGDFSDVEIIEVVVSPGDQVSEEDPLITLESDKASMEVPSPYAGTIVDVMVGVGDRVSEGSVIVSLEVGDDGAAEAPDAGGGDARAEPAEPEKKADAPKETAPKADTASPKDAAPLEPEAKSQSGDAPAPAKPGEAGKGGAVEVDEAAFAKAHASPSVRRFARELGADLGHIEGSGPKGRILREDVQAFVKGVLSRPQQAPAAAPAAAAGGGLSVPEMPEIDFSQFGAVESKPLSKIKRLSGTGLHRNWVTIPHVTHQEEADITELEAFRKEMGEEAKSQGLRLTMVSFLLKAAVAALRKFPEFNASLDKSRENLILKGYFHIGVAVDTPEGLVVPVIRDVDRKGIFELARELGEISEKARARKLKAEAMQGGCFTISSLGGIGGVGFTPIINAPEVAILGVTRSQMRPVYQDGAFVPRLILPLSLSYDHRVIDGAGAARFAAYLAFVLADVRRLVL